MGSHENKKQKKKSGKLFYIIVGITLTIAIGMFLYPTFADLWNKYHSSKTMADYDDMVDDLSDQDYDAMREAARRYNKKLLTDPARFELNAKELAEYNSILDITGTGVMGYVEILSVHIKLPIYHTVEDAVLQIAAGHIPGSSFPIGDIGTHAIISGHSGLQSAKLFTDLEKVREGDLFSVHILGDVYTYQVNAISVVLPEETELLEIDPDKEYVTLVTCTPYGVNSHRLLVRGERVSGA